MSLAANLAEKLVTEHDLSEEELLYLLEHRQEVAPFVQEPVSYTHLRAHET